MYNKVQIPNDNKIPMGMSRLGFGFLRSRRNSIKTDIRKEYDGGRPNDSENPNSPNFPVFSECTAYNFLGVCISNPRR
jgi:hypothetical protein